MNRVQILDWVVEVARSATETAYAQQEPNYPASCKCLYCENFAAAIDKLPSEFLDICLKLGIDPAKPSEVYELIPLEDHPDIHLYGGWYHIVGHIVDKPLSAEDTSAIIYSELTPGWGIRITDSSDLVPQGFPDPLFALEFSGNVPWILEEQP